MFVSVLSHVILFCLTVAGGFGFVSH
jgi:hypothetical protein